MRDDRLHRTDGIAWRTTQKRYHPCGLFKWQWHMGRMMGSFLSLIVDIPGVEQPGARSAMKTSSVPTIARENPPDAPE
jgi:uncharacterized SAM-binding protein YcdF (DUF218 family)